MPVRTETGAPTLLATWTFERNGEHLELRRDATDAHEVALVIAGPGGMRRMSFTSLDALVAFQQDMEAFLVRTGWSLTAFEPDRRTGRDRRGFPRIDTDRRRWWTDVWRPARRGGRHSGG